MQWFRRLAIVDLDGYFVLLLSVIVLVLTFGTLYLAFVVWLTYQAIRARDDNRGKGAYLVFGKKLANEKVDFDYRQRLNRLLQLPEQLTILMGGTSGNSDLSEAKAGYDYVLARGMNPKNLVLEQASLNTLDNLKNARKILAERGDSHAIIISNRYHLARCSALAKSLNITHFLCAAESQMVINLPTVWKSLMEAFYLHWFYVGKIWATCTRNQRMLAKIS